MPKHISDSQRSSTESDQSLIDVESSSFPVFSPKQGTSSSSREPGEERQRVGEDSESGSLSLQYRQEPLALPGRAVSHGECDGSYGASPDLRTAVTRTLYQA